MYPNLYYAFRDLFHIELNGLKMINSFGFFVAVAFLVAAWVLVKELHRLQQQNLFSYSEQKVTIGAPASPSDLFLNFIIGFIIGMKVLGAILVPSYMDDPQSFLISFKGSYGGGLVFGLIWALVRYWSVKKQTKSKPEIKIIRVYPKDRVGDIVLYAAVFGFIGAKVFNALETWDDFVRDPIGSLFSFSGLTFYGGLICATVSLWWYSRKHDIPFVRLCDAAAPALMIAYALGRVGCQVSGDGDWGILNSAYISNPEGHLLPSNAALFAKTVHDNAALYLPEFGGVPPHLSVPSWLGLPPGLLAYSFPHNVINEGRTLINCDGGFCHYLPIPVFPTSFYEFVFCTILFFILWMLRKRIKTAGRLFAIYLVLNGMERFFIETIRVNTRYHFLGISPTQAEIISTLLVLSGIALFFCAPRIRHVKAHYAGEALKKMK